MSTRNALNTALRRLGILALFIAGLWAIQLLNALSGYWLNFAFGLIPRDITGLDGIVAMPLLHGNFAHLLANTPPLAIMGALLAATATRALFAVNAIIVLGSGAAVWLLGSTAIHIGASGLVFGWFGFLVTRGIVDRSAITLLCAAGVGFFFGAMLYGVLPGQPGVSWEAHLFGALAGVAAAILVKSHVHAPRLEAVERRVR
ncbi:MAG: rhomboid family intramembrane serine protease [Shimia sp.]